MKTEHRYNIKLISDYSKFRSPKYGVGGFLFYSIFLFFADRPRSLSGFVHKITHYIRVGLDKKSAHPIPDKSIHIWSVKKKRFTFPIQELLILLFSQSVEMMKIGLQRRFDMKILTETKSLFFSVFFIGPKNQFNDIFVWLIYDVI